MIVKGWFWMDFGEFLMMWKMIFEANQRNFWACPFWNRYTLVIYIPSFLVGHIPFCVPNFDPNPNTLIRLITQNHKGLHDAWWICWYMISGSLAQKKDKNLLPIAKEVDTAKSLLELELQKIALWKRLEKAQQQRLEGTSGPTTFRWTFRPCNNFLRCVPQPRSQFETLKPEV